MFDFCSMIIKVLFLCKNSLRTLSILESLSYSFDVQTDLFKVFMVSWSWLFSSLQLLTALRLPNTHSSNLLHMKPAVPQPHSRRLYEILPPLSVIFAIILCNHFPLYSQGIDPLSTRERLNNKDVDRRGRDGPLCECGMNIKERGLIL